MTNKDYDELVISAKKRLDEIIDVYKDREFTEIVGKMGGDAVTIRVYKNGVIVGGPTRRMKGEWL